MNLASMDASDVNISNASMSSVESEVVDDLRQELKSITQIVKRLQNFKPELISTPVKKRRGRPSKKAKDTATKASPHSSQVGTTPAQNIKEPMVANAAESIPDILVSICQFNNNILDSLDQLREENRYLRTEVQKLASPMSSSETSRSGNPTISNSEVKLNTLDWRLDEIEQDKLADTIKLEGAPCAEVINSFSSDSAKDYSRLKSQVLSIFNNLDNNSVNPEDIQRVSVVGKERKHLKIKLSSSKTRVKVHILLRRQENPTVYSSDYLTPIRSKLAYDLRMLKKRQPQNIKSAYVFNGNICCKLVDSEKILYINSAKSYDNLLKTTGRSREIRTAGGNN